MSTLPQVPSTLQIHASRAGRHVSTTPVLCVCARGQESILAPPQKLDSRVVAKLKRNKTLVLNSSKLRTCWKCWLSSLQRWALKFRSNLKDSTDHAEVERKSYTSTEGRFVKKTDWLLATLNAAGNKGLSPVQFQKSVFLLAQQLFGPHSGAYFYKFIPYNYGPFCMDIYKDAEHLASQGMIEINREGRSWPEYRITPSGQAYVVQLRPLIPMQVQDYMQRVVQWTQNLSFPELVRAIYQTYPEYRSRSVFQE